MTQDTIVSLPKTINANGCWLYFRSYKKDDGYGIIKIKNKSYYLHRLTAALWNNKDYLDKTWMACHADGCQTNCFNPEHLYIGSNSSNMLDAVRNKTHISARKTHCPRGHKYDTTYILKTGKIARGCKVCKRVKEKK